MSPPVPVNMESIRRAKFDYLWTSWNGDSGVSVLRHDAQASAARARTNQPRHVGDHVAEWRQCWHLASSTSRSTRDFPRVIYFCRNRRAAPSATWSSNWRSDWMFRSGAQRLFSRRSYGAGLSSGGACIPR